MAETNGESPAVEAPDTEPALTAVPDAPRLSVAVDSDAKKPRDARLIHMVLANLGVSAYQERVPLQLMDFAYRYTAQTLQDAQHFVNSENTTTSSTNPITLPAVRLAVATRLNYQFQPSLPKPFLMELAAEKNRTGLPAVGKEWGLRLPPEKYCLTGTGFSLRDEWDSSESEAEAEVKEEENQEEDAMEDVFGQDEDKEMEDA